MVKTRNVAASPAHEKFFLELCAFCEERSRNMPADELLAVLCLTVGRMIAYQDQRKYSAEAIKALVVENIEAGNQGAIRALSATRGNA